MALPKLETPTHELVLPSTNKKIKFRPFLVKEQKILYMAQNSKSESEIVNSVGQLVLSGRNFDLDKLIKTLKIKGVKNIKLPVSAPFHCKLMSKATEIMKKEIEKLTFNDSKNVLISNVTADEILDKNVLKKLLIDQIENRVKWRESIINMISKGVDHFVEIGPGKVLTGLVKRINKDVKINTINNESDIKDLKI